MASEDGICPGVCNRRYRDTQADWKTALAAYDPLDSAQSRPERPDIHPWYGEPVWCSPCKSSIRLRLAELDDLIALLKAPADGHRQSDAAERVSGSPGDEVRSPSQAADDEEELAAMLTGWERAYREYRRWPSPPPRGELASAETVCIAWLGHHLDGILLSPLAGDFGAEILQWHREFKSSAKAGVRTLRKPMRCPSCRLLTLTWTEGETQVCCSNPDCNRIMSLEAYDAEVEHMTRGQQPAA
jgi:hypothetical protein